MNGNKYEKRVASYLRGKGYRHVKITKASGDYGVDIIANKHFHKYAIQCKYYAKPVGISAVQQVVAGMAYYDCDRAMVITNNTFTRQANELASRNDVELIPGLMPRSTLLTVFLIRLSAIASLYLLYKLGYEIIVYLYLVIVVLIVALGIYLKYLLKKSNEIDGIETDSEGENPDLEGETT